MKQFSNTAWLARRLEMLEEKLDGRAGLSMREVCAILKINEKQLRRWTKDPYFQSNNVAVKDGHQWVWHPKPLKRWIKAVKREMVSTNGVRSNPPGENDFQDDERIEARRALGMPVDYVVSQGYL